MGQKLKTNKAFTLIELLVVVAIIGILASVVLASLNTARGKARDARRRSDIHQIQNALALYYADNGQYPASSGATSPNAGWSNSNDSSWTTLQTALSLYIPSLPTDPKQSSSGWAAESGVYTYTFHDAGYGCPQQYYMIVYQLENASGISPGVTTCDGNTFRYGGSGANTTIKTVGVNGYPY